MPRLLMPVLISLTMMACERRGTPAAASVLLFDGSGTSPGDVKAVEAVLEGGHVDYSLASSAQLNGMSRSQLRSYRLLIVSGGNFETMGKSLDATTAANIHDAVQGGLNYFGVCAGAFLGGHSIYNGIDLTSGVRFGFYSAENQGIRKAALAIVDAESRTLDQYWEDGPALGGWGSVVAKYPDGTPAIVEGMSGNGWVVLSGVHSEAPESWRRGMTFATTAREDNEYAGTLIKAALNRTWLAHY